jgi:hypothetical protein
VDCANPYSLTNDRYRVLISRGASHMEQQFGRGGVSGRKVHLKRRSIAYSSSEVPPGDPVYQGRRDYSEGFYASMLTQDVAYSIMPHGSEAKGGKPLLRIDLVPEDECAARLIASGFTRRDYAGRAYKQDLADALRDFVESCASTIMRFGEASYEIAYEYEAAQVQSGEGRGGHADQEEDQHRVDTPCGFRLLYLDPRTLLCRGKAVYQLVPERIATQRGVPRRAQLPREQVVWFVPPPYVRPSFDGMLETLALADVKDQVTLYMKSRLNGASGMGFDHAAYIRTEHVAVAFATRLIGWNARGAFADEMDEYYLADRQLRFARFRTELRASIVESLNEVLTRVGGRLGFTSRLMLAGGMTAADVHEAQARLAAGDTQLGDLLRPFL